MRSACNLIDWFLVFGLFFPSSGTTQMNIERGSELVLWLHFSVCILVLYSFSFFVVVGRQQLTGTTICCMVFIKDVSLVPLLSMFGCSLFWLCSLLVHCSSITSRTDQLSLFLSPTLSLNISSLQQQKAKLTHTHLYALSFYFPFGVETLTSFGYIIKCKHFPRSYLMLIGIWIACMQQTNKQ